MTDHSGPAHSPPPIGDHSKLTDAQASIIDLLAMPLADSIEFEPPRLRGLLLAAFPEDQALCGNSIR